MEWSPAPARVHALVDDHGVRSGGAELEAHIGYLIFLTETQCQRDVLRSGLIREGLRQPACQVVGIVEVRQVAGRMSPFRVVGVAHEAAPSGLAFAIRGRHAVPARRISAGTRCHDLFPERRVDEIRSTSPRLSVLRVAGIRETFVEWERSRVDIPGTRQ